MRINSGPGSLAALTNFDIQGIARSIGDSGAAPTNTEGFTILRLLHNMMTYFQNLRDSVTNTLSVDMFDNDAALANGADLIISLVVNIHCVATNLVWACETNGAGNISIISEDGTRAIQIQVAAIVGGTPQHGTTFNTSMDGEDIHLNFNNTSGGAVSVGIRMRLS